MNNSLVNMFRRAQGLTDIANITDTVNLAFGSDPTWSPLLCPLGDTAVSREYWDFFVRSASRFPWSYTDDAGSAASVWYPPGAAELTPDEEAIFPSFAQDLLGFEMADQLFRVLEQFEKATPVGEYFYLSLLAVHPAKSGAGLGLKLLRENLIEIDLLETPSYLESSNPKNDHKYESLGYRKHGKIELPSGLTLTTMWRDPKGE